MKIASCRRVWRRPEGGPLSAPACDLLKALLPNEGNEAKRAQVAVVYELQ
jgi:hypothetical protein